MLPSSTARTPVRALVVDDEPSLIRVVAGYLEHEGFVVTTEGLDPTFMVSLTQNDALSTVANGAGQRLAAALDALTQAPVDN